MKRVKSINQRYFSFLSMMLLLLIMVTGLVGCNSDKEDPVSIYDLQKAMLDADKSLPDMLTVNSSAIDAMNSFSYLSDLDYSKVDCYYLAYSSEGKADEVAVICVKDEKDTEEAKKSLETHAAGRVALYKNYDPSQMARAEDAEIFKHGRYVVLLISDNKEALKGAFSNMIR